MEPMNWILVYTLIYFVRSITVAPSWVTSPYVQADSQKIINGDICSCVTDSSSTPIATMNFVNAFTLIPNLGYGISNYQADDSLYSQQFEVNRTALTTTSFSVLVQISGSTNIWVLQVRYIAISYDFPHHLNSFDNVPVNYNNGALSIINTFSSSPYTYTNTINYTLQAQSIGSSYITFSTPLTNNKILLFMTSLFIQSTSSSLAKYLYVTATPQTNATYTLSVTSGIQCSITRLHFSMIIFDRADVQSSGQYLLVYQKVNYTNSGGFYAFPVQFLTNFIIGFIQYSSSSTWDVIHFQTFYQILNGLHGARMPASYPRSSVYPSPFDRYCFTYFYLKTWLCPNQTVFDPTINLCVICPIVGCLNCFAIAVCQTCNSTANYFLNITDTLCYPCTISNCIQCSSLTMCETCDTAGGYTLNHMTGLCQVCTLSGCINCTNTQVCAECDNTANYIMQVNSTCSLCPVGLLVNQTSGTCQVCSLLNCIICQTLVTCLVCDISNSYYLATNLTCSYCNSSINYFINSTLDCELCTLANCIICSSLTTCTQCNETAQYFINTTDSLCYPCPIGYFLNSTDKLCYLCQVTNCLSCVASLTCSQCEANYYLTATQQCQLLTTAICGDDILAPTQFCDDGNLVSNDGCSNECLIQTDFSCKPNPTVGKFNSLCLYIGKVQLQMLSIQKYDLSNELEIVIRINASNMAFWDNVDFTRIVSLSTMTAFDSYTVKRNIDGTISVFAKYNTDIHSMNITVQFDPKNSGMQALSNYTALQKQFIVIPTDNEAALFYPQNAYQLAKVISFLSYIIAALSLLFIVGIFAGKLIGVQLMSVLQISYLSLITINQMNPCFKALSNIWFVNGFNYFHLQKKYILESSWPIEFKGIGLYARFIENYNFTVILIVFPYILSLVFFVLSKTLYKSNSQKALKMLTLAKRCACEAAFNGIMFSGYIIAVSLSLQLIYGFIKQKDTLGILSIAQFVILTLVYLIYSVLLAVLPKYFGQFISYFQPSSKKCNQQINKTQTKQNTSNKSQAICSQINLRTKWYHIMMAQRLVVGMGIVFMVNIQLSNLVPIAIFLILGVTVILWRPYQRLANNIRFCCNMFVNVIIQVIFLCYKINQQNNSSKQIWFFLPLIICVLIIACIVYNSIMFVYEIVNDCKTKDKMRVQAQQTQMYRNIQRQMKTMNSPNNSLLQHERTLLGQNQQLDIKNPKFLHQISQLRNQLKRNLGIQPKNMIEIKLPNIDNILSSGQYQL